MKIKVEQRHIDYGKKTLWDCPVARAAKEQYCQECSMGATLLTIGNSLYYVPEIAQQFIKDYDEDKPVTPFEFDAVHWGS